MSVVPTVIFPLQSLRHSFAVPPPFTKGRLFFWSCYPRQKKPIRSHVAASDATSTDGLLFPFQNKTASLGFVLVNLSCTNKKKPASPNGDTGFCRCYPRKKKLAPLLFRPSGKSYAMLLPFSFPSQTRCAGLWLGESAHYKSKQKSQSERTGFFVWSCYPDSNWGPHPYQGCALPTEL